MSTNLPGPVPTPDAGPYWEAANQNKLVMQRCSNCQTFRFIPSLVCPQCSSHAATWDAMSGGGVIHSLTTVHRGPTEAFRAHTPYVLALIDLAEGPRMMANIIGADAARAHIGDAVQVCFEARAGGTKVPQFRLSGPANAQAGNA